MPQRHHSCHTHPLRCVSDVYVGMIKPFNKTSFLCARLERQKLWVVPGMGKKPHQIGAADTQCHVTHQRMGKQA